MKNIIDTQEDLELFDTEGNLIYAFKQSSLNKDYFHESIFDKKGNKLKFKNSNRVSVTRTYDSDGNLLERICCTLR